MTGLGTLSPLRRDQAAKALTLGLIVFMLGFSVLVIEATYHADLKGQAPTLPRTWPPMPPDCRGLHDWAFADCIVSRTPPPKRQAQATE